MTRVVDSDELLAESAPLAREMATTSCRRDPESGETCAWYHGLWQDLRVAGLGSKVSYQAEFLAKAVALAPRSRPRVLVAGAADYALLAHVLAACDAKGLAPSVTVLDLCETPLRLNAWYSARIGRPIATCRADMFEHAPHDPYDLIVAHSFIGYFPPERRRVLFHHWASMLAPSGALAVVNRVRDGDPNVARAFSAGEADTFRAATEARLKSSLSPSELGAQLFRASAYVRNHRVYPLPPGEITSHFEAAGLRVDVAIDVHTSDERNRDLGGVAVASDATYACVAGTRPSAQLRQK